MTGPGVNAGLRGRGRRPAFTLVEILATLALVAIVLPSVMMGISLALAAADQARHQDEAASLAHTRLSELVATGETQQASLAGDFGDDWPGYRWIAEVADWEDTRLRQLAVTVFWTNRGRERSVTLTTLVYVETAVE